jgi:hypothetical protein
MTKQLLALILMFVVVLFLTGCGQKSITSEELEGKIVVLSEHEFVLEPLQSQDFFLGLKNELQTNATFYVSAVCRTNNCDNNIVVQTFPVLTVGAGKKAAFPISLNIPEQSQKGSYTIKIDVTLNKETYGSDEFTVEVPRTIDEIKQNALKQIFK